MMEMVFVEWSTTTNQNLLLLYWLEAYIATMDLEAMFFASMGLKALVELCSGSRSNDIYWYKSYICIPIVAMNVEALVVAKAMLVFALEVIISMQILSFYTLVHYYMPQIDCVNAWLVSNQ